jgi:hypothetical protein
MPIIACPNCKGKLRFPDDSPPRRVKCPTCGHVFQSNSGADATAPVKAGSPGETTIVGATVMTRTMIAGVEVGDALTMMTTTAGVDATTMTGRPGAVAMMRTMIVHPAGATTTTTIAAVGGSINGRSRDSSTGPALPACCASSRAG